MIKYETPFVCILDLEDEDIVTVSNLEVGTDPNGDIIDWGELNGV